MMNLGNKITFPSLVILQSKVNSTVLDCTQLFLTGLVVWGPAELTGTVNVYVSMDTVTWAKLQSGGSDIAIGAADAVPLDFGMGWNYLRLTSGTAEAADRVFGLVGVE